MNLRKIILCEAVMTLYDSEQLSFAIDLQRAYSGLEETSHESEKQSRAPVSAAALDHKHVSFIRLCHRRWQPTEPCT